MVNASSLTQQRAGRCAQLFAWMMLCAVLAVLPASLYAQAERPNTQTTDGIEIANPAADLWRAVRQRNQPAQGLTQVRGPDAGITINPYGQRWREFRMQELIPTAGYALLAVVVLLLLFYLIRGRIKVEGGVSDKKLFRYSLYERIIHWLTASTFLFLALTGLILLFGRSILIPVIGQEGFSLLASASKEGHNLFGPLFGVCIILMFFQFVRRNIYQKGDLTWLLKGGGIIGKGHVPSNFFNMGEKSMFWMLILVGGVIVASGLVLVFPVFGQGRVPMELAHVSHAVTTIIMTIVIMGHIYIGSVGMEGALDGMTTGYCDLNWAKEHHEQWAEQCEQAGEVLSEEEVMRQRGEASASRSASPGMEEAAS